VTDDPFDRLAPLADPVRRALYDFVVAQPGSVDRDAAAAGAGVGRPLAAFHLDRLAAAGLLDVAYRRRNGRSGPGAGRPAKFYSQARGNEVAVSLPPRTYDTLAEILAEGVERSRSARGAAVSAAHDRGRQIAEAAPATADRTALVAVLAERGYQPVTDSEGVIRLRNCPFDRLVDEHRELTCSLNLAMLGEIAEGYEAAHVAAEARPPDTFCCVAFVPEPGADS
jgi:predicted ArsR family transcriptional regulator